MQHDGFIKPLKALKQKLIAEQKEQRYLKNLYLASLIDRDEETLLCSCKDASGKAKYLYTSQRELSEVLSSAKIKLYIYPCPTQKGWHLTKTPPN